MFWQDQALRDTLFVMAVVGWGIIVSLLIKAPGLMGFAVNAYRYHRSEGISLYLSRFIPSALFSQLIDLGKYLLLTIVVINGGLTYGLVAPTLSGKLLLTLVGGLVGGLWVLSLLRRALYALWSYVFMPREASELLRGDYNVISVVMALVLIPLSLLSLSPVLAKPALYALCGLLAIVALLRMWQAVRRLAQSYADCVYIFLYLCTHELLPWLYIALVALMVQRGDLS